MRFRRSVPLAVLSSLLIGSALFTAHGAAAGGGPLVPSVARGDLGIASPDGRFRYVTFDAGEGTTVARIQRETGIARASNLISRGREGARFGLAGFGIPQVAADGSPVGLSADGATLVLVRAYGPINRAEFLVLDTKRLKVSNRIVLDGQFSFDALSPDGRTAYVVEYPRKFVYTTYRVRELDLQTGRLTPGAITDVDVGEEPEGPMRGLALTRADSEDGRWAYTLYDGGGGVPFIHALDTVEGDAVCIFLEQLQGLAGSRRMNDLTLSLGDSQPALAVVERTGEPLVQVDTESFAITEPAGATDPGAEGGEGGFPYFVVLVVGAGVVLLIVVLRRRRRSAPGAAGPAAASSP